MAVPTSAVMQGGTGQWQVGLFDPFATGGGNCIYAFFCPACAMATARSQMDDSDWCFNCLCMGNHCASRSVVRHGYNIEGSCCGDICIGCFCGPCTSCQVLSETEKRGRRKSAATAEQEEPFKHDLFDCSDPMNCLISFIFPNCAFASARSRFDGSDCLFNCCCMSGYMTQSLIRKGYNLEGGCCMRDILTTLFCCWCVGAQLLNETKTRGSIHSGHVTVQFQGVQKGIEMER